MFSAAVPECICVRFLLSFEPSWSSEMYREWLAVAIGGMTGAMLRHGLTSILASFGSHWAPVATLIVNTIGCFAIGALFSWSFSQQLHSHWMTIGVRVGLLGGLTTFSSFALDAVQAWNQRPSSSLLLIVAHLALGVSALLLGLAAGNSMIPPAVAE